MIALEGGESLNHFHERKTFKLKGLNKPWKAGGFESVYATVEYGKEDWFHSPFDKDIYPDHQLKALFDLFKNSEESLWKDREHKVVIKFDGYSSSGRPVNPVIKEIILDRI